jgi:hypothetical protein
MMENKIVSYGSANSYMVMVPELSNSFGWRPITKNNGGILCFRNPAIGKIVQLHNGYRYKVVAIGYELRGNHQVPAVYIKKWGSK